MYDFKKATWNIDSSLIPSSFVCWNCGNKVSSKKGYCTNNLEKVYSFIYLCPHCNAPTIIDDEGKKPLSNLPGEEIGKLPSNVERIYNEIRKSMQSQCYNGAIMLMRKLIMHIAVEEGAEEGKNFTEYIDYLYSNGNIPKKSKNKSDSVRILGNNVNHRIENKSYKEAKNCFDLVGLLLKVNYEFADEEENE